MKNKMSSRLKIAALIPLLVVVIICACQLAGCGTAPVEGHAQSENPAADDYCRRNPESVLCSTSK